MKNQRKPQAEILIPCYMDQFSPQTGFNMVRILKLAGCDIHYNIEQTCCGKPAYDAGLHDMAKEVGEKFVSETRTGRYIVTPSASCTAMLRVHYQKLFENTAIHNTCKSIQKLAFEFSEFIVDILGNPLLGLRLPARITFLDSCSGLRDCNIFSAPRKLLSQVEDLEIAEMNETETCCGFGGIFSVKQTVLSIEMAENRINQALQTGAEFLVSTDYSCLMHLESYIAKNNLPLKTLHIADLLVKGIK